MSDIEILLKNENKIKNIYQKLSKLFIVITLLFFIWIIAVALGTTIFDFRPNWALLNLDYWLYAGSIIIAFFIVIELLTIIYYIILRNKRKNAEKPKTEYRDGKLVHVFTYPIDAEGGIFSKTYVKIDDNNVLRLKTQMIQPSDIWIDK
jgi:membrane protein YdbS with pleckstrin-like domain